MSPLLGFRMHEESHRRAGSTGNCCRQGEVQPHVLRTFAPERVVPKPAE
jgi:hypothetical protein